MLVMEGWERQRFSTALPIMPVEPVRMIFMVDQLIDFGDVEELELGTEMMGFALRKDEVYL